MLMSMFFFFQAEDGIRDLTVTGVQTCALPISTPLGGACPRSRNGRPEVAPPSRSGEQPAFSVGHSQRRWERTGDVDLPELRFVLRHVVLQRMQKAFHVLGAVDHPRPHDRLRRLGLHVEDRKSTRLNSSHSQISYA